MRAAVCRTLGPPEVVEIADLPVPELGPGQVRIRVAAGAVNFPDVLLVAGEYQIKVPPPFVVGSEMAGVVTEVADDVESVGVGDAVTGTGLMGAFAEEAVIDVAAMAPAPVGLTMGEAAAAGVAHRTALHVLRSTARVAEGEEVVVLGAGGGVGLAAVQLGSALGASVTAVASSEEKLAVAAGYSATHLLRSGDGDLRHSGKNEGASGWNHHFFRGDRWCDVKKTEDQP